MFLIEHLPKEASPIISVEPIGYVPQIVKQIENNLKTSMTKLWLPSQVLRRGTRDINDDILVHSFGSSCPLKRVNLVLADPSTGSMFTFIYLIPIIHI